MRLYRVLNCTLSPLPIDLWRLRIATYGVGTGVLALVAIFLPRIATNQTELFLGLGLAFLNCLVSVMFGTLATRIEIASSRMKIPARARILEWVGYAAGLAILISGMWFTTTLPLSRAGFMSAFLLILAMALATFCVGILFTLVRHDFPRADIPGGL